MSKSRRSSDQNISWTIWQRQHTALMASSRAFAAGRSSRHSAPDPQWGRRFLLLPSAEAEEAGSDRDERNPSRDGRIQLAQDDGGTL